MDFEALIKNVNTYAIYSMLRETNSAEALTHFKNHKEMENQYTQNLTPDELGRALVDSQMSTIQ